MGKVRFSVAVSLDGFLAGPDPSVDEPLGEGGMQLHEWAFALEAFRRAHGMEGGEVNESTPVVEAAIGNVGAHVMGRNMFGGGPGPWGDEPWPGWWGDDPPFHTPVYVLTHHPREPLELEGGTTFVFVTEGLESALRLARETAAGRDVVLDGGANLIKQCLAAGVVDEFTLSVAPVLLGGGTRLLDGLPAGRLDPTRVVEAPGVVHLSYRLRK
jgi:dihydrofolate reductase